MKNLDASTVPDNLLCPVGKKRSSADSRRCVPSFDRRTADDLQLTRRLVGAGALLGVDVLDRVIVGDERYLQFQGERLSVGQRIRRPATQLKVLEQSIEVRLLPICCQRAIREAPKPHESLVC